MQLLSETSGCLRAKLTDMAVWGPGVDLLSSKFQREMRTEKTTYTLFVSWANPLLLFKTIKKTKNYCRLQMMNQISDWDGLQISTGLEGRSTSSFSKSLKLAETLACLTTNCGGKTLTCLTTFVQNCEGDRNELQLWRLRISQFFVQSCEGWREIKTNYFTLLMDAYDDVMN